MPNVFKLVILFDFILYFSNNDFSKRVDFYVCRLSDLAVSPQCPLSNYVRILAAIKPLNFTPIFINLYLELDSVTKANTYLGLEIGYILTEIVTILLCYLEFIETDIIMFVLFVFGFFLSSHRDKVLTTLFQYFFKSNKNI